MTLQRLPKTPVVHLAAKFLEEDRAPDQCVCGVLDELPPEKALHLAALLIPKLKKVTLIHSASEKTFPEAAAFEAEARRMGIEVQRLMIQAQSELYTVSQHVATDSQLIALLKDHMVVAGITTLVECAERLDIPLMAADEGSVQGGASFAAGVPEAAIGAAGGRLIHRLIAGEALQDLPIDCVEDIHLFYRRENPSGLDYEAAAHSLGYTLTEVEG
jgi:putative ABC transport system substrate-binding protein